MSTYVIVVMVVVVVVVNEVLIDRLIDRLIMVKNGADVLTLLRGTIVNRTYGIHKKPVYLPIFTNNIWSYLLWSPVVAPFPEVSYSGGPIVNRT